MTVIEGKQAVLYCNATSYLFIRWQHNGKYVDYYDEYHINTLGSHLTVRKATKKDAGTYVCIAYNERYNTRQTVELIVWGMHYCISFFIDYLVAHFFCRRKARDYSPSSEDLHSSTSHSRTRLSV